MFDVGRFCKLSPSFAGFSRVSQSFDIQQYPRRLARFNNCFHFTAAFQESTFSKNWFRRVAIRSVGSLSDRKDFYLMRFYSRWY